MVRDLTVFPCQRSACTVSFPALPSSQFRARLPHAPDQTSSRACWRVWGERRDGRAAIEAVSRWVCSEGEIYVPFLAIATVVEGRRWEC